MPRNQSEQAGFVMDLNTQKLIEEAQIAFDKLHKIAGKFQTVANADQFTGNDEDDAFIAEMASFNVLDDLDDVDDVEDTAYFDEDDDFDYYGRGIGAGKGGCGCGCGCKCKCQCHKPELYPCKCRICDLLKAKAYTNLVLGINDLKDAFDLLCLAKEKFNEAVDSIQDAQKLFKKARCCAIKYGCHCYCKTRRIRRRRPC